MGAAINKKVKQRNEHLEKLYTNLQISHASLQTDSKALALRFEEKQKELKIMETLNIKQQTTIKNLKATIERLKNRNLYHRVIRKHE